jgi:hypothetical protein
MTGYLQRLASNARNPGGGVHPLVGSLYSRPEPESLPPLMEEQAVAPPPSQPREGIFTPLIEPLIKDTTTETTKETVAGTANRSLGAAQPMAPGNIAGEPPLSGPSQLPKPHSTTHLEHVPLPSEEARPTPIAQFRPPRKPARLAPEPAKPGNHDDAHGSGDIQIHIGRIEVTAVPPPLPRAAAPPAPKSISLAEYLKRGRGRSS